MNYRSDQPSPDRHEFGDHEFSDHDRGSFDNFRQQLRERCHGELRKRRTRIWTVRIGTALGVLLLAVGIHTVWLGSRDWGEPTTPANPQVSSDSTPLEEQISPASRYLVAAAPATTQRNLSRWKAPTQTRSSLAVNSIARRRWIAGSENNKRDEQRDPARWIAEPNRTVEDVGLSKVTSISNQDLFELLG